MAPSLRGVAQEAWEVREMAVSTDGEWGEVLDTGIMGIHQVLLGDGRVLYWGDDGAGAAFSNTQQFGIYDPITGDYEIVTESYVVRMFCGAGVIIPGTDQVLIAGGNGIGENDGKVFDASDEDLDNVDQYIMADGRFYPTMVSLATGQLVILGGKSGAGVGTPEIFTPGEGWKQLDGAYDADVEANWWYPKAWVNGQGEILYIALSAGSQGGGTNPAGTFEVMALDVSGDGSIRQVAEVPFQMDVRSTAVMYDVGKVVVMDHTGDLWIMDINGDTPTFTFAADLPTDRENGDMTVMADGRILLNGGTTIGNSQDDANAVFQSIIFDPFTGDVSFVDSEEVLRTYHSSSILLPDGTIMSSGGGGLSGLRNFQDAQIYSPDYLFNDDDTLADRPVISVAPGQVVPGESFVVTVDDAATIARMSFVKTGAVTHSTNMESGRMDLEFSILSPTQIEVTLPDNPNVVGAGNWMLFAIDDDGVPSVAPIISVNPTVEPFEHRDGTLLAEYYTLDAPVTTLAAINFDDTPDFQEDVRILSINTVHGTAFEGGPSDQFAVRYSGDFEVDASGDYTFYLTSDDGSRLFIDGQEIIANDGLHAAVEIANTVNLGAGSHTIEVRYFEATGSAVLDLDWSGPGFGRTQMEFVDGNAGPSAVDDITGPISASDLVNGTGGVVKINGENVLLNDSDPDGDALSIVAVNGVSVTGSGWQGWRDASNGGQIVLNTDGRVQFRDRDGDFDSLPEGEVADTSITYTISDGSSTSQATITFSVEGEAVVGQNIAPDAVDDVSDPILVSDLTDVGGGVVKIKGTNVLQNDSDANGDSLSIVDVNGTPVTSSGWQGWRDASHGGQITVNTDGRVQFRDRDGEFDSLPLGEQVSTSITYTISDGNGGTSQATITFVVEGEAAVGPNVDPVAGDDLFGPVAASDLTDGSGNVVKINGTNVLDNDSDANGDALDIVAIGGEAVTGSGWQGWRDASTGGQIVLNTDGRVQFRDVEFEFADLAPGETVDTALDYTVSDGNGGTDTATVTFTIAEDGTITALDLGTDDTGDTIV